MCTTTQVGIFSGSIQSLLCVSLFPFFHFSWSQYKDNPKKIRYNQLWSRQCHPSLCLEGKVVDLQVYIPITFSACTSDCFIFVHQVWFQLSCQMLWISLLSFPYNSLKSSGCTFRSIIQTHLMCMYPMFRSLNVG